MVVNECAELGDHAWDDASQQEDTIRGPERPYGRTRPIHRLEPLDIWSVLLHHHQDTEKER